MGAGEILLNSIDHDGSNKGFNLQLLQQIKSQVSIPVIASSGAGNPQHFQQVFEMDCGIDAALGAGLFHREYTVNQVKKYLQQEAKMDVRLDEDLSCKGKPNPVEGCVYRDIYIYTEDVLEFMNVNKVNQWSITHIHIHIHYQHILYCLISRSRGVRSFNFV